MNSRAVGSTVTAAGFAVAVFFAANDSTLSHDDYKQEDAKPAATVERFKLLSGAGRDMCKMQLSTRSEIVRA
jgi:hypothetical protein